MHISVYVNKKYLAKMKKVMYKSIKNGIWFISDSYMFTHTYSI